MKRIICVITLIYALSASMFLSGCSKQDEIKKVTVDEVRSELSGYEFSQHENLNFDCSVQNTEIGNVYKYKLHDHSADKAGDEEKKNAYALWRTLVSDESVQPKYSQDTQNCWFARAEKPYSYGAFYCGGSFGASSWDWGNDESADINETTVYKTMRACDDFSGKQYRVGGEDYKLTDAVKFCDDYIDKNLKQYFNEGEQLKLINVFVIENKMFDKYTYAFRYAHLIDGVAIDDCDSSDLEKEYTRGSYLEIILAGKDKIYSVENRCYQGSFDNKEKIDELVALSQAEKLLAKQLAPKKKYTVTECELKYVCRTVDKAQERYYEPMWCFTLEQYPSQSLDFKRSLTAYVNAVTGKVFLFDMDSCSLSEL